jgi:hypothetical protein
VPDTKPCPKCKKLGFIRVEHVIKGRQTLRLCYCGACLHEWVVANDGSVRAARPSELAERSSSSGGRITP